MRAYLLSTVTTVSLLTFAAPALAEDFTYTPTDTQCDHTWANAHCWGSQGVPGDGDSATLDGNYDVSVDAPVTGLAGLTVTGGFLLEGSSTIEVAPSTTVPAVTFSGDAILSIALTLDTGVTSSLQGLHISAGQLNNEGIATWLSGDLIGDGAGVINNSGTFIITPTSGSFTYGSGLNTCDFYNTGTISDTNPGTTNNPDGMWGFHLSGTVSFTTGGTFEWRTASNTSHDLSDGATIAGNGTLLFDTPANGSGDSSLVTVTGTTTVDTGATLQFADGSHVMLGTHSGTIGGSGALVWTGGTLTGNANLNVGPSLTWASPLAVHLTGSSSKDMASGYLVNKTKVLWDQGQLGIGDLSYLTNEGTLTISGDATTRGLSIGESPTSTNGYAEIENDGTIVKSTGTGQLVVNKTSIVNKGTIDAASGSIVLLSYGANTNDNANANILAAGSTLSGNVVAYCEVTLSGASTVAAGATFELGNDGMDDYGTLDGDGTLGGPGTVRLSGALVKPTGLTVYADPATITFAAGGNVVIEANAGTTALTAATGSNLIFAGTTSWTGGAVNIPFGTVTNTGDWTTTAAAETMSGDMFANSGTFTVDPGAGNTLTTTLHTINTGTVTLKSGTGLWVNFGDAYTQTAGSTVLAGGELSANFDYPGEWGTIDIQGGMLSGSGTIDANVTNEGTAAPGTATAAGSLTVTQKYTQTGTLDIALGGDTAGTFDVLSAKGGASVGGDLVVSLLHGYVPSVGDTYGVVPAPGGVTGTFHHVTQPDGVTLTTTYEAKDVVLGVTHVSIMQTPDAGVDARADAAIDSGPPPAVDAGADSGHALGAPDSAVGHDAAVPADATREAPDASRGHSAHDAGMATTDATVAEDAGLASSGSGGGCSTVGDAGTGGPALGWLLCVGLGLMSRRSRVRRALGSGAALSRSSSSTTA